MCANLFEFKNKFRALENSSSIYNARHLTNLKENIINISYIMYIFAGRPLYNRYFAILVGVLIRFLRSTRAHRLRISRLGILAVCDLFSKVGNVGRRKMKERAVVYGR